MTTTGRKTLATPTTTPRSRVFTKIHALGSPFPASVTLSNDVRSPPRYCGHSRHCYLCFLAISSPIIPHFITLRASRALKLRQESAQTSETPSITVANGVKSGEVAVAKLMLMEKANGRDIKESGRRS
ncbi:hypothetical protein ACU8KH_05433 [Lachancea thermotolerans]